jgi:hypothetical protein
LKWGDYKAKDGTFSCKFPSLASQSAENKTKKGYSVSYALATGETFAIGWDQLPPGELEDIVKNYPGPAPAASKPVEVEQNGFKGLELRFEMNDPGRGGTFQGVKRVFTDKGRIFFVAVAAKKDTPGLEDHVKTFFDSARFDFSPKPESKPDEKKPAEKKPDAKK